MQFVNMLSTAELYNCSVLRGVASGFAPTGVSEEIQSWGEYFYSLLRFSQLSSECILANLYEDSLRLWWFHSEQVFNHIK